MSSFEQKRIELLRQFDAMDTNHDGVLDMDEIDSICQRAGLSPQDKKEFYRNFDSNGDKLVTLDEFELALGIKPLNKIKKEELHHLFNRYDKDKSGFLTASEMHQVIVESGITNISKKQIEEWLRKYDKNADGSLSFQEFCVCYLAMNVGHEII
ncbi:hypothetical protein Ciccas_005519 [Cichlidogyrus casuarinus]|uniref:EF-hand domain-containing protein n=1 Tax=Cichlidogyrus casuarinus TaxID=1844966 RepID=A0ABD2Q8E1_9PLAT